MCVCWHLVFFRERYTTLGHMQEVKLHIKLDFKPYVTREKFLSVELCGIT